MNFIRPTSIPGENFSAIPQLSSLTKVNWDDWRAKIVCNTCNNGWMSQIETSTSHVLKPLIVGELGNLSLSDHDASAIARWAILRAAVLLEASRGPASRLGDDIGSNPWLSVRPDKMPLATIVEAVLSEHFRFDFGPTAGYVLIDGTRHRIPNIVAQYVRVSVFRFGRIAFRVSYMEPALSGSWTSYVRSNLLHAGFRRFGYLRNAVPPFPEWVDARLECMFLGDSLRMLGPGELVA